VYKRQDRDQVTVLFAGRLSKQKRPELFIDLAVRLLREFPQGQLTFQVAGDGPLRAHLESLATDAGLPNNVFSFLGVRTDMNTIYRQSDILVLTSGHEGTPNVVLEAMAHGIPVVATKVGGVPEILSAECGIVVEPSDFDGLCTATARLLQDPDLRSQMGRNARKYVEDIHSLPAMRERLIGIYSKLVEGVQLND
jgi:glycosyltransferase involved in cell wall biosynthesis